jgi:glutaredoxin 3
MEMGLRGVPAFLIGDDVVSGLDTGKILALVDHRLIPCENCKTKMRIPTDKGSIKVTCPKCGHSFKPELG